MAATFPPPLLKALKVATAEHHAQLEHLVALDRRLRSRDGYRGLLARFYGAYAVLEAALEPQAATLLDDWAARRKTPLLAADLSALGLAGGNSLAALPLATPPRADTLSRVAGCLYVTEGATLGGQLIARQLGALGVAGRADAFFTSYGPAIGPMWKRFGEALARAPLDAGETCAAARDTFAWLAAWFAAEEA